MKKIKGYIKHILQFNLIGSVMLFVIICIFVDLFCNVMEINILHIARNKENTPLLNASLTIKIVKAIFLAPFIETLIFQYAVFKILANKTRQRNIILVSALLFGLSHFYSLTYIINTFLIGLFLATAFVVWKGKKVTPFLFVFIIHSCYNLFILITGILNKQ